MVRPGELRRLPPRTARFPAALVQSRADRQSLQMWSVGALESWEDPLNELGCVFLNGVVA
jgi:hypothetical protein